MSPQSALHELRERYAALRSYQDDGVVLSQLPGRDFVCETKFATSFTRPDRFRFDMIRHHPYPPLKHVTTKFCIWQDTDGVHFWWEGRGTESLDSLSLAISGAKGISGGASFTVPAMLLATTPYFSSEFLTVHAVADGATEGIACRCIIASDPRRRPYRLYVGREDLLLHRVSSSVTDGASSDEIHRNIRTNHTVGEETFCGGQGPLRGVPPSGEASQNKSGPF